MGQFSYVAVNRKNEKIQGVIEAPNEAELRVLLRAQQLRPIKISKAGALTFDLMQLSFFSGRIKNTDLLVFTRQLALLLTSGIPIVQGLEIISTQGANPAMQKIVLSIKEKVTGGGFLWEAMASYKKVFPSTYVSMVRAGEVSGSLDIILKRLISYMEEADKLKKMVKGAMIYPTSIVLVGIAVIVMLIVFVIPKFEATLKGMNRSLPAPTQIVISISHFMQDHIFTLAGMLSSLIYVIIVYLKTDEGKRFYDFYILRAPIFGGMVLKVSIARFARTVQTLLSSGVNLLDALDISKSAIDNKTIEESIGKMKLEIEHGKTLAGSMSKVTIFPAMVVQLLAVGEATGNIDKMLQCVADFYEEELTGIIAGASKMIEPIILVGVGGIIAGLMLAMYLPIFTISG